MPEIKSMFLKGKMNKDLDERVLPKGEYRDAQNILINDSEDSDVAAIENILGNQNVINSNITANADTKVIGHYVDIRSKKVFYFITDFSGATGNISDMSNITRASGDDICKIIMYDAITGSSYTLVEGIFLNFSKHHLITGVNLIDDLLFWTDNYNQPRKININNCYPSDVNDNGNVEYYTLEEQISVAKIAPYTPAVLVEQVLPLAAMTLTRVTATTLSAAPAEASYEAVATTSSGDGTGAILTIAINGSGAITAVTVTTSGSGYLALDTLIATIDSKTVTITLQDNDFIYAGDGTTLTKDNDINSEYLKEKFVRFSYRYKFEDGEYSIMAPFTQIIFSPLNNAEIHDGRDSNAINNDSQYAAGYGIEDIWKKGVVNIMQNYYNKIKIRIPLPSENEFNTTANASWVNQYKLSSIEILLKESDGISIKVVDKIKVNTATTFTDNIEEYRVSPESGGSIYKRKYYKYIYKSEEPYKVLPEDQTIRVFDQVPVKAHAQEVSGNRVIYGNFTENYRLPVDEAQRTGINYTIGVGAKGSKEITGGNPSEHGNLQHLEVSNKYNSVKQRRTYQVGIVLSDRFGRQSPVILSTNPGNITDTYTITNDNTSYYNYYNSDTYSWSAQEVSIGKALNVTFKDTRVVPTADLYSTSNPHGWYSWKVVVKQNEQEFYNIYAPHPADDWNNTDHKFDNTLNGRSWLTLHGDNINKIPRDVFEEDASRPGVSGSDMRLFPKVISDGTSGNNFAHHTLSKRNTDGTEFIEVISIGNAKDQNLYLQANKDGVAGDASGVTGFSILPFVHGHDRNPLVAELPNLSFVAGTDNSGGIKASVSSDVPDPGASATYSITLIGGSTPSSTILAYDKVSGPTLDEKNVNIGASVSSVSGTNLVVEINKTLIKNAHTKIKEGDRLFFSHYKEGLSVFETEPFKSKLDIYYETSTGGLLRDINENTATTTNTPTGLAWSDAAAYKTILENDEAGEVNGSTAAFGTLTATPVGEYSEGNNNVITGYTLLTAQDNAAQPNNKTSFFSIVSSTGAVSTNGEFTRFSSTALGSEDDGRDTFTLTIQFVQTDGGTSVGTVTVKTVNSNPTIASAFNDGTPTNGTAKPALVPVGSSAAYQICNGTATNGSEWSQWDTFGISASSYSYTFPSGRFPGYFEILASSPGNWEIQTTSSFAHGTNAEDMMAYSDANRYMTITITDPGGLTATHVVRIDIIPVRYSFLEEDPADPLSNFNYLTSKMSYSGTPACPGQGGSYANVYSGWIEQGDATSTPKRGALEVGNVIYTTEMGDTRADLGGYKWTDSNYKTWMAVFTGQQPPLTPHRQVTSVVECT